MGTPIKNVGFAFGPHMPTKMHKTFKTQKCWALGFLFLRAFCAWFRVGARACGGSAACCCEWLRCTVGIYIFGGQRVRRNPINLRARSVFVFVQAFTRTNP